jgi:hemoglobin
MITASSVTGVVDLSSRDDIERMVRNFYRQAAMDELLGPVFAAADVDWPSHIATLTDFWAWQLFGARGYEGNPLRAHEPVHACTPFAPAHYQRWLELFCDTVDADFGGPVADKAKLRGSKMADALRRLLAGASERGGAPTELTWTAPTRQ